MRSIRVSAGIVLCTAAALLAALATPAGAQIAHPSVVSANPANWTPKLPNYATSTATYAFAQIGSTMYAGGQFTSINGVARTNIVAFNATTGTLTAFKPNVNGAVWGLAPAPDGKLFVAGYFTSINGASRRGVAKIDPVTGAVDPTFLSPLNGNVSDLKYACGRVFVGGWFTKKLLALNPTTGADTGYLNLGISGSVSSSSTATHVYRFAVSPNCSRLVGIGNFTTVAGKTRYRAFMVALGTTSGSLDPWYYQPLTKKCASSSVPAYLRGVDFSPDGSYFVIDGTGYVPLSGDRFITICDAAARFETAITSPTRPTWINYTGGDTLHSVAISGAAVYVGGHQRWLDNPYGRDSAGTGAVSRPGIGALNPATGKALTWNPTRTRGVGAKVLYVTPAGLWVGSDTEFGGYLGCSDPQGPNDDNCAGQPREVHPGIGFLPLT
jgi:hypothetical protein